MRASPGVVGAAVTTMSLRDLPPSTGVFTVTTSGPRMLVHRVVLPFSFSSWTIVTGWACLGFGTSSSLGAWKHMTVSMLGDSLSLFSPGFGFLAGVLGLRSWFRYTGRSSRTCIHSHL